MLLRRDKTRMPTAADALPGRAEAMEVQADGHLVLGTPLMPPFPDGCERAMFGMGCFWGAERFFWQIEGVYTTAVGYSGGVTANPTYQEVCSGRTGHNEVVLVVHDPSVAPYEQLLKVFWEMHDPTQGMRQGNDAGTQYRSGIYVFSEAQREEALASRDRYQAALATGSFGQRGRWFAGGGRRWCWRHHRDRRRRPVLLRRGVPPAIPGPQPLRLLQPRLLPGRLPAHRSRGRLTTHRP